MYYTNDYGMGSLALASAGSNVWTIIALVLAICGAIVGYFLFIKPDKSYPSKFVNWFRGFLNFQEMLIEPILKVTYAFMLIFITLTSFNIISYSFPAFLLYLIGFNLVIRVVYEASMMMVGIWKNTKEINKKMKK